MSEIYRVVSTYSTGRGGTYEVSRRFFTKRAAEYQAKRRFEGWTYEAINWDEDDYVQEPALAVRIEAVSVPDEWVVINEQSHA